VHCSNIPDNKLHREGYVSIDISLFVSSITQKVLYLFSQNSVERWHTDHGRSHYVLDHNLNHITLVLGHGVDGHDSRYGLWLAGDQAYPRSLDMF